LKVTRKGDPSKQKSLQEIAGFFVGVLLAEQAGFEPAVGY
jgi:hypothetical protein